MEPHYSPSVFNFYEFDYAPAGVIGDAKLVSPEAQLLTGPFVIGFLNAFVSMAEVGLSFCYDGFAATDARKDAILAEGFLGESVPNCNPIRLGSVRPTSAYWSGNLTWTPRASVVDELGTDHGWGGHALLLGGGVAGGQILGEYPADFSEASELNVGRGRMIPTTPWEGLWAPVATWFGVDDDDLSTVLPNIGNFPEDMILDHAAVFR